MTVIHCTCPLGKPCDCRPGYLRRFRRWLFDFGWLRIKPIGR